MEQYDAVVIGGGPAGLSAALWLGRYQRRVLVCDTGEPRNEPAWAVHGYPGLQDPLPSELRRRLFTQAQGAGAEIRRGEARRITGTRDEFTVEADDTEAVLARRIVLSYGLRDYLPEIDGMDELYGTSIFHCPDCDGPAVAGSHIGVIGWNRDGARQALYLRHWTEQITLLPHGRDADFDDETQSALDRDGVAVRPGRIERVSGHGGNLTQVEFEDGSVERLDAIFFHLGSEPRCDLGAQLGCDTGDDGYITVDRGQETSCAGVHAAGDITGPPHLAASAAAEGVRAALAIHRSLLPDWRHL